MNPKDNVIEGKRLEDKQNEKRIKQDFVGSRKENIVSKNAKSLLKKRLTVLNIRKSIKKFFFW